MLKFENVDDMCIDLHEFFERGLLRGKKPDEDGFWTGTIGLPGPGTFLHRLEAPQWKKLLGIRIGFIETSTVEEVPLVVQYSFLHRTATCIIPMKTGIWIKMMRVYVHFSCMGHTICERWDQVLYYIPGQTVTLLCRGRNESMPFRGD